MFRSSWISVWPLCSLTGQPTPPLTTSSCTGSAFALFHSGVAQLAIVLTKLMSFSPEAPRPTAANADQGAREKKSRNIKWGARGLKEV